MNFGPLRLGLSMKTPELPRDPRDRWNSSSEVLQEIIFALHCFRALVQTTEFRASTGDQNKKMHLEGPSS